MGPKAGFRGSFTCYSVACIDMPDLEFGDKVILPPKVLLEMQCLKIALPIVFKVTSSQTAALPCQYCSVLEFSAPDGQMYAPYWMMQNLLVDEGGPLHLETAFGIPRGIYCRFQPHESVFLDLAAALGPKVLLEAAMRKYSVLSIGETIAIEYGAEKHLVTVVEVKPGAVVHLFGDVDLEVDFKAPENTDPRRPKSAAPRDEHGDLKEALVAVAPPVTDPTPSAATPATFGRRLGDGGYVQVDVAATSAKAAHKLSFQEAQRKTKSDHGPNPLTTRSLKAFETTGYVLETRGEPGPEMAEPVTVSVPVTAVSEAVPCGYCLGDIPRANFELHELRCKARTAYHRVLCSTCGEKTLKCQLADHVHCPECPFLGTAEALAQHHQDVHANVRCPCGATVPSNLLRQHQDTTCPRTLTVCSVCTLSFPRVKHAQHLAACSSRTLQCERCKQYINVLAFNQHEATCIEEGRVEKDAVKAARHAGRFACPYCTAATFDTMTALDKHTEHECTIARSFNGSSAPLKESPPILRGKLRRKTDLVKPRSTLQQAGGRVVEKPVTSSLGEIQLLKGASLGVAKPTATRQRKADAILNRTSRKPPTKR
ncbi:ubiquitin fusion degradation protein [Achlya hypogyna]|uniref:Ubiquitin fusion degradation protein n=1 Tax=Achlya hypogyna TaxID=1202772 RepID=A0A1V9YIC0_ACHHY|nr:ubiquitin fusion degradation protein [Achlya hypogyna]